MDVRRACSCSLFGKFQLHSPRLEQIKKRKLFPISFNYSELNGFFYVAFITNSVP